MDRFTDANRIEIRTIRKRLSVIVLPAPTSACIIIILPMKHFSSPAIQDINLIGGVYCYIDMVDEPKVIVAIAIRLTEVVKHQFARFHFYIELIKIKRALKQATGIR